MPKTRSGAYLWLATFAGVYMLVLTVFIIFAAARSSEPQLAPSTDREICVPDREADRSTAPCLA